MKLKGFLILSGVVFVLLLLAEILSQSGKQKEWQSVAKNNKMPLQDTEWTAPTLSSDSKIKGEERDMVVYGQDLIAHTAKYLGPKGSISQTTNGMNCQNCHLDAGTRRWGNNYSGVYSTYPQIRARSNTMQDIYGRVNDCLERSLNGRAIANNSFEMQSIYAYMKWLGQNVPKGKKPNSSGLPKLPLLIRAASSEKGKVVYINVCQSCHGNNGHGVLNTSQNEYVYPPLWGEHSYNDGAGLFRLSSFASFVKNNMPYNQATRRHPKLSDEEAWDVAAFVNSQPRPRFNQTKDWPDLTKKPFDAPYGPYADSFSTTQHKYGPYNAIINTKSSLNKKP